MTESNSKEEKTQTQAPEKSIIKSAEEITKLHTRAIYELVTSEAIKLHPDLEGTKPNRSRFRPKGSFFATERSYVLDVDKAVEILSRFKSEEPDSELPPQEIFKQAKQAFRQSVKALVDNKDISPALAKDVGDLLRPSGTSVIKTNYFRFLYLGDDFPEDPKDRAILEVGLKMISQQLEKDFKPIFAKHGVDLTEEQILNILLRNDVSHEYGHAIDRALMIVSWKHYLANHPNIKSPNEFYLFCENYEERIFDEIAPDSELGKILAPEPKDGMFVQKRQTSSERVASGFEYLGLQYALEKAGIDATKIDLVIASFKEKDKRSIEEYKAIAQEARARNLNMELIGHAINDLSLNLKEQRKRPDLAKILAFGISARNLGYYFSLNREQIHKLVETFWTASSSNNTLPSSKTNKI